MRACCFDLSYAEIFSEAEPACFELPCWFWEEDRWNQMSKLSRIAAGRLQKELAEWHRSPPQGFFLQPSDNLQKWMIQMRGASGTLYADELFTLQVDFPENYPMEAPQVIFHGVAPVHPHIYSNGHICLDILYDSWSPAMTISSVCMSILSMLSSCTLKELPSDNDKYVERASKSKHSPKDTRWWFHDDKV